MVMAGSEAKTDLWEDADFPMHFGKYELLEPIGAGGMAEIFKARQSGIEGFEKILVIKRILPGFAANRAFIRMLIDEAKLSSVLQHPNIVQIYDLGQVEGQYYIAMEFVHGKDVLRLLSRCVKLKRRIPLKITLYCVSEVCKGLSYAHAARDLRGEPLHIIHRDVSPSNIILSFEGAVKIMDFGVARARTQQIETRSGVLKGKLGYMSPEQVTGRDLDFRSDIFALGTILYEAITLKRLFLGRTDLDTLTNIRDVKIEPRLKRHHYIPGPIKEIIRTALARRPEDRYPTAMEFHDALVDYMYEKRLRVRPRDLGDFIRGLFDDDGDVRLRVPTVTTPEDQELEAAAEELEPSDSGEEVGATSGASEDSPPVSEMRELPVGYDQTSREEASEGALEEARGAPETSTPEEPREEVPPPPLDERGSEPRFSAEIWSSGTPPSVIASAGEDQSDDPAGAPLDTPFSVDEVSAPGSASGQGLPRPGSGAAEAARGMPDTAYRGRGGGGSYDSGSVKLPQASDGLTGDQERLVASGTMSIPGVPKFRVAETTENSGEVPDSIAVRLGHSTFRLRDSAGNIFGPVSFSNFINLIKARTVTESEMVSVDGDEWRPARSIPGIREIQQALFRPEGRQPLFNEAVQHLTIPRILYRLWAGRYSGKLKFSYKTTRKEIYLLGGKPQYVASSLKGELLGSFLVARKIVSPQQLQTAIQRMTGTREKLGDALVDLSYLRHHELFDTFERLHRRKLLQIFVWNTGRYEFFEGARPPRGVVLLDQDTPRLIAEGVREFYGFDELKAFFKPYYPRRIEDRRTSTREVRVPDLRFNSHEARFSTIIETGTTLVDLLRRHARVNRDALTLFRVLFLLFQMELVRFSE